MTYWIKADEQQPPNEDCLLVTTYGLAFVGRKRYGLLGEPQQNECAYRCSSSGKFVHKIDYWMPIPALPEGEPA